MGWSGSEWVGVVGVGRSGLEWVVVGRSGLEWVEWGGAESTCFVFLGL